MRQEDHTIVSYLEDAIDESGNRDIGTSRFQHFMKDTI